MGVCMVEWLWRGGHLQDVTDQLQNLTALRYKSNSDMREATISMHKIGLNSESQINPVTVIG